MIPLYRLTFKLMDIHMLAASSCVHEVKDDFVLQLFLLAWSEVYACKLDINILLILPKFNQPLKCKVDQL